MYSYYSTFLKFSSFADYKGTNKTTFYLKGFSEDIFYITVNYSFNIDSILCKTVAQF